MKKDLLLEIAAAVFTGLDLDPASIEAVLEEQGIEPRPEYVHRVALQIVEQCQWYAQHVLHGQRWDKWLEEASK